MQKKVGSLALIKFFGVATLACYGTQTVFGPGSVFKDLNIRHYWPKSLRWDSISDDNRSMVGADIMAAAILYFWCAASGMYIPLAAFAAFDVAYYGP